MDQKGAISTVYQLKQMNTSCRRCPELVKSRKRVTWGYGDPHSDVMFIGEAPGRFGCDVTGIPFTRDRSGEFFQKMLSAVGLDKEQVYTTNIVKCLDGRTRVYLEDGSSKPIRNLVLDRYSDKVITPYGPRKVTGWYKSPLNNRKLYKICHHYSKSNPRGVVGAIVTEDHEILTKRGWIQADKLITNSDLINTGTPAPSTSLIEIIEGSLLGDGGLNKSYFYEGHSEKQKEYLNWKKHLFESAFNTEYFSSSIYPSGNHGFRTLAYPFFRQLRERWYKEKKVIPKDIKLTPLSLAIWYMDNGHYENRGNRSRVDIACMGFNDNEIHILRSEMKNLGIDTYISDAASSKDRIFVDEYNTDILFNIIHKYIPSCMKYKLSNDYIPQGDLFTIDSCLSFYSPVIVHPYPKDKLCNDVYCIDVEEVHCFTTPGGVVHNCCPPINRTPTPQEIENCSIFLQHEIIEVKPKLTVLMGKPAIQVFYPEITSVINNWGRCIEDKVKYSTTFMLIPHPAYIVRNLKDNEHIYLKSFKTIAAFIQNSTLYNNASHNNT